MGPVEDLVVGYVPDHHVNQVVKVAGHQMATEDLRAVADRPLEGVQGRLVLTGQRDLHKYVSTQTNGSRVH